MSHPLELTKEHLAELLAITKIGSWDWDIPTGRVVYSPEWAKILGYAASALPQVVSTWENMVLPEDLPYANEQIARHLRGEAPIYEAEFRMRCQDGQVIWAQDKGKVTECDENGKPLRFVGVLQDVSRLKNAELNLRKNQETLDLAVNVSELGTWDWDIPGNTIKYNDEYLHMLGYSQSDINGSIQEWEGMNHPEDLPGTVAMLNEYLTGKITRYECEIRMKHKDGHFIWTRDVGRIVEWDADGNPTRLIGGHLNIDAFKVSEKKLTEAKDELEHNQTYLESEIESRTTAITEQDRMLWTVNQISRDLLTFQPQENFDILVQNCLRLLGEAISDNRVYIWKDHAAEDGVIYCTQIYEWVQGVPSIQGVAQFEKIPYSNLPSLAKAIDSGKCLNSLIEDLSETERAILDPQGIQSTLIAPITINGKRWGFIGIDNCESKKLFTITEETMLIMSGAMLASTIEKVENEAQMREIEERTQLMLNATPLCLNLWSVDGENTTCNDEAVRLFGLASQREYLERFDELSPKYQPNGQPSPLLAAEKIAKAFEEGYLRFEWMHQKPDGTPIPAEITLVRVKFKDSYIVAGYTRDMREQKAMLAQLQKKEDDLRTARDEALLSSKAKSNFLANMSHEIRTPMNAISGLAEIMLRESKDKAAAEHAMGIKHACGNLLNIINDILDISKIESGKLEVVCAPYELASLLNDAITVAQMRLGANPIAFITDIDSRLPARLVGDEIRIKQILVNLLSNALKFTQEGHVALRVSGQMQGTKAELCFTVTDTGYGIKAEDVGRLFDEFERVNTTKNRNIEGTGLGLAISKRLCEMMGGSITLNSVYGKGSVFTVSLPQECPQYTPLATVLGTKTVLLYEPRALYSRSICETVENLGCHCVPCANQSELSSNLLKMPYDYLITSTLHLKKVRTLIQKNHLQTRVAVCTGPGEATAEDADYTLFLPICCLQITNMLNGQGNGRGYGPQDSAGAFFVAPSAHVLVVDDNAVNLKVASGLMAPYQFSIDTACDGLEAVEKVRNNQYDLVFMDHMMPKMDGIDATVAIRRMPGDYYQTLPIVALTANALVGTREMFIREGMNDFLAKPVEINKLGNVLAKWIPEEKKREAPKQEAETASASAEEWAIEGLNTAQGIRAVGGDKDNYLQILSVYYADGLQKCTSLQRHLAQKNYSSFQTEIHALKSTSATIGAAALSAMAATLEAAAQNQNVALIEANIDTFLAALQKLLGALRPMASASAVASGGGAGKALPPGSNKYLHTMLSTLQSAAELASIGQMEDALKKLQGYQWPEDIAKDFLEIQKSIAIFDYDGVLECANRLQKNVP